VSKCRRPDRRCGAQPDRGWPDRGRRRLACSPGLGPETTPPLNRKPA